jgi:hypothetical protein
VPIWLVAVTPYVTDPALAEVVVQVLVVLVQPVHA